MILPVYMHLYLDFIFIMQKSFWYTSTSLEELCTLYFIVI